MRFFCKQSELNFFLKSVSKIAPQRSTISILEGIYLRANHDKLNIAATNLEAGIKNFLNIEMQKEGAVVLPGKFTEIIRFLPENNVEVEVDEKFNTLVCCGKAKFVMKGIDPAEYPELPEWEGEEDFKIEFYLFKEMIRQTIFTVSQDEGKPALLGIYFSLQKEVLTFISTDSFRISLRKGKVQNTSGRDFSVTVPVRILNELVKFNFAEEYIRVKIENNQILFKIDDFLFFSMLSEEKFPQVERIIPSQFKTRVQISRTDLLNALQRVIIISENNNFISKLEIKDNGLILKANSNIGSIEEELEIKREGSNLDIYLNTRFLIEPLRVIESDQIILNYLESNGPCVISSLEEAESFLYLILPIKS